MRQKPRANRSTLPHPNRQTFQTGQYQLGKLLDRECVGFWEMKWNSQRGRSLWGGRLIVPSTELLRSTQRMVPHEMMDRD